MTTLVIANPYDGIGTHWLKGEIHTHVNRAAGSDCEYTDGVSPETIYDAASAAGLNFVCMSVDATEATGGAGFFGDAGTGQGHGVVGIPGREIQNNFFAEEASDNDYFSEPGAEYLHVLTIGVDGLSLCLHPRYYEMARPKPGGGWQDIKSALLNAVAGNNLDRLRVSGIEVYNGFTMEALEKKSRTEVYSDYDEVCWDEMLMEERLYWGFAGNDAFFHKRDEFGTFSPLGLVYAAVSAKASAGDIVDALRRGRFYASTGIELADTPIDVSLEGSTLRIDVTAGDAVDWTVKVFRRTRRRWGLHSLHAPNVSHAEFLIDGEWKYVRVQCERPKDPWQRAWLQPITNAQYFQP